MMTLTQVQATILRHNLVAYTWKEEMKKALAVLFVLLSLGSATQAFAGNCQHDSDTASDGSRCGGRSADSRPGGR
ncbi:transmembrane anchored protein [Citrobacter freundii]|nr:transmembrane anchored protein [Citrobacter freundii]MDN4196824.1 transmembrane anchored protein [Citrobacter freundii]MDN4227299.1 transmembrane anchored protein [Citrobacter freundii]